MIAFIIGLVVVLVVLVVVVRVIRNRQDPVDSFRRQIDALSPEARRPTVDQVRDAADDSNENDPDDS